MQAVTPGEWLTGLLAVGVVSVMCQAASVSYHFLEHKLTNQRAVPNLFLMDHFGSAQIHTHTRQFIEIS